MIPKLLALAKVCSVLGNIRDVSWHLSKRGSDLEKRWTFSILDKNGSHKNNKAWYICIFKLWPLNISFLKKPLSLLLDPWNWVLRWLYIAHFLHGAAIFVIRAVIEIIWLESLATSLLWLNHKSFPQQYCQSSPLHGWKADFYLLPSITFSDRPLWW